MCYSRSNPNQVVWHYAELGKVGEGVYTYLQQKDQYREEDDMIAIVLQLEDVFFEYGTYSRRFLADKDVAAAGAEVLKNFHRTIEQTMQEGRHLQLLLVRIYEELGLDAAPLIRYREVNCACSERTRSGNAGKSSSGDKPKSSSANSYGWQGPGSSLGNTSPARILSGCANSSGFPYRFAHTEPCPEA